MSTLLAIGHRRKPNRRQALRVLAAAVALPLGALALSRLAGAPQAATWTGESLGGPASVTLWHQDPGFADRTLARVRSEVERLERVFSLYRHDSEIVALNRDGRIADASPDLIAVLDAAAQMAERSNGAFDPTVQPLWRIYSSHFRAHPDDVAGPDGALVHGALAAVGFGGLDLGNGRAGFLRDGMAVTLNGIAQGYITDRVADLLREEGFDQAMVDVGETRALGENPEGGAWPVLVRDATDPTLIAYELGLRNEALSVSSGLGTRFGPGTQHHIFDPSTGFSAGTLTAVSVIAPRAMLADALSTAVFVGGEAQASSLLGFYPGARAILTRLDGTSIEIG